MDAILSPGRGGLGCVFCLFVFGSSCILLSSFFFFCLAILLVRVRVRVRVCLLILARLFCLFRDEINFDKEEVRPEGAVIAARITAENPDAGNSNLNPNPNPNPNPYPYPYPRVPTHERCDRGTELPLHPRRLVILILALTLKPNLYPNPQTEPSNRTLTHTPHPKTEPKGLL
jgi:hypothetical protein